MSLRASRPYSFGDGLVFGMVCAIFSLLVHRVDRLESTLVITITATLTYGLITFLSDRLLARTRLLDPRDDAPVAGEGLRKESLASVGLWALGPATGLLSLTDGHVVYRAARFRARKTVSVARSEIAHMGTRRLLGAVVGLTLSLHDGQTLTFRLPDASSWVDALRPAA